jgi:predicted nucleic acid-binding Zn ribbon protein
MKSNKHFRKTPIIIKCQVCGGDFEHWNYQPTKTCSKECASKMMCEKRKRDDSYHNINKTAIGSKPETLTKYHRKQPVIARCQSCGKEFEHWNYGPAKTCSKECSSQLMSQTRKKEGLYTRTEAMIEQGLKSKFGEGFQRKYEKVCPICGRQFFVVACQRGRRKTCSKRCMGTFNGNQRRGTHATLEQREHLSKVRKERGLAKGRNNPNYGKGCHHPTARGCAGVRLDLGYFVRSRAEANYARILVYEKIEYQYEPKCFPIVREDGREQTYTPDFYLVDKEEFIEVKGYENPDSMDKFECFRRQYPDVQIRMLKTSSAEWKALKRKFDKVISWEK